MDKEALHSMLMAWYMSGYHTGYYQVTSINCSMVIYYDMLYVICKMGGILHAASYVL